MMFQKRKNEFAAVDLEIPPGAIKKTKELGKGCYKTVYLGECHSKEVAIGVPHMQKLNEEQRMSLLNEIRIMKNNPHPNIILFMGASTGSEFMIITELLQGDLEHLLKQEGGKMTLFERLLLAKDAALGMNWLHNNQPAIIHRDLKTANLLYLKAGDSYQVKVCDFGLSDIKPKQKLTLRDPEKAGAKGTPLYMPPEIMQGKDFNEKADVYSYAMCLWEIYTCQDLFPDHNDYDEFVKAVCKKHERPPLPHDCLPSLKLLLDDCWHSDPKNRPDFTEINDRLDEVLVDAAISDSQGREFWKKNFLKKRYVSWDEFAKAFYKFLGLPLPYDDDGTSKKKKPASAPITDEVIQLRCLRALAAVPEKPGLPRTSVEIQWFGNVLNWFGPLDKSAAKQKNILATMKNVCEQPWFHGDMDIQEAQRRLQEQRNGTFLVRFSTTSPGAFTITRVNEGGGVTNAKVIHKPGGGFSVTDKEFATLGELIVFLKPADLLGLVYPCSGSRFLSIFQNHDSQPAIGAYENPTLTKKSK